MVQCIGVCTVKYIIPEVKTRCGLGHLSANWLFLQLLGA